MTHATMSRRKALAAVAVAPAALASLPTLGLCKDASEGGELAALVRRYFEEVEAFNVAAGQRSDEEWETIAKATYDKTLVEMIGVPARNPGDALAVIEFMERENMIESWCGPMERLSASLIDALRGYLEGRVA